MPDIVDTLSTVAEQIAAGRSDPIIRDLAERLVAAVPAKDEVGEMRTLFYFVRDTIRQTRDPWNVELVRPAVEVLRRGQGDCDDLAVLLGALAMSVGYPARVMAYSPRHRPDTYKHVAVEVFAAGAWRALDPILSGFDVRPQNYARALARDVETEVTMTVGQMIDPITGEEMFTGGVGPETGGDALDWLSGAVRDVSDVLGKVTPLVEKGRGLYDQFYPASRRDVYSSRLPAASRVAYQPGIAIDPSGVRIVQPTTTQAMGLKWATFSDLQKAAVIGGVGLVGVLILKGLK